MNVNGRPRGRWRLTFDPEVGFRYGVQAQRGRSAEQWSQWPSPDQAWGEFTQWESRRSRREIARTGSINSRDLITGMQRHTVVPREPFDLRLLIGAYYRLDVDPGTAMLSSFGRQMEESIHGFPLWQDSLLEENVRAHEQASASSVASYVSKLPPELLELILTYCLEVRLDLVPFHEGDEDGSARASRSWTYAASERAALAGFPRAHWMFLVSLPTFHVSTRFRDQTLALVCRLQREWAARLSREGQEAKGPIDYWVEEFRNRMHAVVQDESHASGCTEQADECAAKPLLSAFIKRLDGKPTSLVRELPHHFAHWIKEMCITVVYDWKRRQLVTPLKRLLGFEHEFPSLEHIRVSCRIINLSSPEAIAPARDVTWGEFKARLYLRDGVFHAIMTELSRVVRAAVWGTLTQRMGIWPGFCLRPSCTSKDSVPCRARMPPLAYRMPVIDVNMLPAVEDWRSLKKGQI